MSDVKSSGPATSVNQATQGSSTGANLLGAGTGGAGVGIGGTGLGGSGFNVQDVDQITNQALNQASAAVSANEATDNIQANTTINFGGGNTGVF